jgi:hypothetical protein
MKEQFKEVKPGQPITAGRANREGAVLERVAGIVPGPGVYGRHSGTNLQLGTRPGWNQGIVTVTDVLTSGVPDPPIFLGTSRRYNFQNLAWTDQVRKWQIDAKGLDIELSVGDRLVVYWDAQRGMLVPVASSSFGIEIVGFLSQVDHPGRGNLFAVWLGEWQSSSHSWLYDESAANTYSCIDWRNEAPEPEAYATGLAVWRPSSVSGRILEVVDMDCISRGEESSESSSV